LNSLQRREGNGELEGKPWFGGKKNPIAAKKPLALTKPKSNTKTKSLQTSKACSDFFPYYQMILQI
jgi:hypothetical protein